VIVHGRSRLGAAPDITLVTGLPDRGGYPMRATLVPCGLAAVLLSACSSDGPTAPSETIDISGTWRYHESTIMVVQPEQAIMRLECVSPEGVLTIEQNGSTFTGTLTHTAGTCLTPDGQEVPTPWTLPYHAVLSGSISGHHFHFDQFDEPGEPPVRCPKHGSVEVANGQVVQFNTTGFCDLSVLPFPALSTNTGTATRP
jgi:hypothetical protein